MFSNWQHHATEPTDPTAVPFAVQTTVSSRLRLHLHLKPRWSSLTIRNASLDTVRPVHFRILCFPGYGSSRYAVDSSTEKQRDRSVPVAEYKVSGRNEIDA